ncbi:MAG: DNA polymerase III subunit chi [Chlamydiota bacterium]
MRVLFFPVNTPKEKILKLLEVTRGHFRKKEHLLFQVSDEKSAHFLDDLLWKAPPESFLPHLIVEEETAEWIAITKMKKNLNNARYVFNLCPTPFLLQGPCELIYEFEDKSSPNRQMLSKKRFEAYRELQYKIASP